MPSITLENNIIHNNEGYGVILVKPSRGEYGSPQEAGEGRESGSDLLNRIQWFWLLARKKRWLLNGRLDERSLKVLHALNASSI